MQTPSDFKGMVSPLGCLYLLALDGLGPEGKLPSPANREARPSFSISNCHGRSPRERPVEGWDVGTRRVQAAVIGKS
jgi:hypothetical protein